MGFGTTFGIDFILDQKFSEEEINKKIFETYQNFKENLEYAVEYDYTFEPEYVFKTMNISENYETCNFYSIAGLEVNNGFFSDLQFLCKLVEKTFESELAYLKGTMYGEYLDEDRNSEYYLTIYKDKQYLYKIDEEIKELKMVKDRLEEKIKQLESKYLELRGK